MAQDSVSAQAKDSEGHQPPDTLTNTDAADALVRRASTVLTITTQTEHAISFWPHRRQQGAAGMQDRSSRPHHSPHRTPPHVEAQMLTLRRIASARSARTGLAPSTAHRILARHGLPPLAACDRATGEPIRRLRAPVPRRPRCAVRGRW